MTVSLIISTYNWPRALYLCLDSVMQQTAMPTEILIADDGSGISTRDVVRHFEAVSPVVVCRASGTCVVKKEDQRIPESR